MIPPHIMAQQNNEQVVAEGGLRNDPETDPETSWRPSRIDEYFESHHIKNTMCAYTRVVTEGGSHEKCPLCRREHEQLLEEDMERYGERG